MRPMATVAVDFTIPSTPDLRKIQLLDPAISRSVGLIWKKNKQHSQMSQTFAAIVKSIAGKTARYEMW
jgi:hypothetical protein